MQLTVEAQNLQKVAGPGFAEDSDGCRLASGCRFRPRRQALARPTHRTVPPLLSVHEWLSEEFDQALEATEAKVIELFAMIGDDLPRATAALLGGDDEMLPHLVRHQQEARAWYPQIEAMVTRQILRQAPVAADLRFLLSVLSAAREFERAHCSLVHIAARAGNPVIVAALICHRAARTDRADEWAGG